MKKIILLIFLHILTATNLLLALEPILHVFPTNLPFGSEANIMTFEVTNKGDGILDWSISISYTNPEEGNWISVNPPHDTTTSKPDTVSVTVVRKNLKWGTHQGTVKVTPTVGDPVDVTVTVEVKPVLNIDLSDLNFGSEITDSAFVITNSDSGILEWSINITYTNPDEENWVTIDALSNTPGETRCLPDSKKIKVSVSRDGRRGA